MTLDTTGRMLLGTDIAAALAILEGLGIDVIGLNCSTGPEHMREPIRFLGEHATLPVSCIPNAGLPLNVDGEAVYPLEPEPFAEALVEFVEKNHISVVGGCCGTTPDPPEAAGRAGCDGRAAPAPPAHQTCRAWPPPSGPSPCTRTRRPLLIGERCNAQGSRKFKHLLLAEDYDAILEIGREQVDGGAHALDISVAVTERADEAELMRQVVKKLALRRGRAAGDRYHRAGCDGDRPQDRSRALPDQFHPPGRRARQGRPDVRPGQRRTTRPCCA